ncbi:perlucin-like protein [Mytilus galloprovincialis]|uniref:perlucin-like protein n=1 Tax=Mytilus galloprovincialis TaxID=29158 RepID=UPI003F7C7C19
MFLSAIMVLCCISMTESNSCDISKEKSTISSMLQSIEKKMKEKCSTNSGNCPAGWKKYKDHCYSFSRLTKTWPAASGQCKNLGGYLVKITDSAENTWVVDMMKKSVNHRYGYWMGLADFNKEGDYRWMHDSSKITYSNWIPQLRGPHRYGQNEDCIHFYSGARYEWNDFPCTSDGMGYVCECSYGPNCRPFHG